MLPNTAAHAALQHLVQDEHNVDKAKPIPQRLGVGDQFGPTPQLGSAEQSVLERPLTHPFGNMIRSTNFEANKEL